MNGTVIYDGGFQVNLMEALTSENPHTPQKNLPPNTQNKPSTEIPPNPQKSSTQKTLKPLTSKAPIPLSSLTPSNPPKPPYP